MAAKINGCKNQDEDKNYWLQKSTAVKIKIKLFSSKINPEHLICDPLKRIFQKHVSKEIGFDLGTLINNVLVL